MHPICYLTCICCVHNHFSRASFFRETGEGVFFSGLSFIRGTSFLNRVGLSGGGLMKGVGLWMGGGSWASWGGWASWAICITNSFLSFCTLFETSCQTILSWDTYPRLLTYHTLLVFKLFKNIWKKHTHTYTKMSHISVSFFLNYNFIFPQRIWFQLIYQEA